MDVPWELEARGLRGLRSFLVSWQVQTFLATLLNKEGGGRKGGREEGRAGTGSQASVSPVGLVFRGKIPTLNLNIRALGPQAASLNSEPVFLGSHSRQPPADKVSPQQKGLRATWSLFWVEFS